MFRAALGSGAGRRDWHGTGTGTGAAPAWTGGMVPLQEAEVVQAIRLLTRFGQVQRRSERQTRRSAKRISQTDPNTRLNLQQLLGSLAAKAAPNRTILRC